MIPSHLTGDRTTLESVSRQGCQTLYLGDKTALCRVLGKYIMFVDTEDIGITPHLCFNGYWESWITMALAQAVKPGWRAIDIGANHGYYTLIMADAVGADGAVLAVEPNPRLAELLKRNIDVNGFPRSTRLLSKAISDESASRVTFVIPEGNRSMNGTLCGAGAPGDKVFEVETTTLDEAVKDWPRVDFIKIDAEGAEEGIWRGMQRTLEQNPAITIIMEVNALKYRDPRAFIRQILDAEFSLRYIDYESNVKEVSEEQLVSNPSGFDWMLFLRRD
ncbi:MAG TPA: FkbM family methyltransferase [Pyrinomonadaceae bacterium]|jgi:FkbM family methyltransferase